MARRLTIIITLLLTTVIFLLSAPAHADIKDTVRIVVSVAGFLEVEYTGDPIIYFDVDEDDLNKGSKVRENLGDLNWGANVPQWKITVARTEWDTENGDPDQEFWLQAKYGPSDNNDWVTVPLYTEPDAPATWIEGSGVGSGTYEGVDWKINDLDPDMEPGMYWCTVIIAIAEVE